MWTLYATNPRARQYACFFVCDTYLRYTTERKKLQSIKYDISRTPAPSAPLPPPHGLSNPFLPCPDIASPELREHLSRPHKTRRFGRRPYPIPNLPRVGSSVAQRAPPGSPSAGYSFGREWEAASPPGVAGRRAGFPGKGGEAGVDVGGGVDDGCAEWVVSFSASLERGVTTMKVGESLCTVCMRVR